MNIALKKLTPSTSEKRSKERWCLSPYHGASRFSGGGARLVGPARGGADGDVPVHRKALWEFGPATEEVVGGEVGATVCVLVVSNSRALFPPPRQAAGRRNGGGGGSGGCNIGHSPVSSPANRFLFPLPFTVCCVFDVLKQEREREQRHEQHYRRPQHCGPGPQRRAGWRRWRRRRRRHRGNPGD